jgi:hypothetical protein
MMGGRSAGEADWTKAQADWLISDRVSCIAGLAAYTPAVGRRERSRSGFMGST